MRVKRNTLTDDNRAVSGLIYLFVIIIISTILTGIVAFAIIYQMYGVSVAAIVSGGILLPILGIMYIVYLKTQD